MLEYPYRFISISFIYCYLWTVVIMIKILRDYIIMNELNEMKDANEPISSDSIIIIPTYNEKENIENIIRYVFSLPKAFHILVIDDGSPDGTATIVKSLQILFPSRLHLVERKGNKDWVPRILPDLNGPFLVNMNIFLRWMPTFRIIRMT